ncbi:hypothetical protein HELRODRAFT_160362 [Helobdella robusta]|uniref:Uncharacterized protein n=1 Tax=Helobdella robusta TaxID=6412 RepID=T1EQ51_HELRO|nr:hypothetical protein HELRODRAFT_160362 [Helobdella robusta]ESO06205.1 hypothetical protein HELRODRAFT_160362 [Helobdella robusta]
MDQLHGTDVKTNGRMLFVSMQNNNNKNHNNNDDDDDSIMKNMHNNNNKVNKVSHVEESPNPAQINKTADTPDRNNITHESINNNINNIIKDNNNNNLNNISSNNKNDMIQISHYDGFIKHLKKENATIFLDLPAPLLTRLLIQLQPCKELCCPSIVHSLYISYTKTHHFTLYTCTECPSLYKI